MINHFFKFYINSKPTNKQYHKRVQLQIIQLAILNSPSSSGLGIVGFCEQSETLEFVGSFAADHRQNQHFRSEQNKALRSEIIINSEICALTTIQKP